MQETQQTMYRVFPEGQPQDAIMFTANGRDEAMRLAATAILELDPLGILAPSEYVVEEARGVATPPPDLSALRFALNELDALRSEVGYEDGDHAAVERDLLDEIAALARAVVDGGGK